MDRHLKVKQILPYVARHRHTTASVSYSAAVALLDQTASMKGERRVKGERVTSSSFQDVCTEHLVPRDSQARGTRCCTGWGWGHNLLKMPRELSLLHVHECSVVSVLGKQTPHTCPSLDFVRIVASVTSSMMEGLWTALFTGVSFAPRIVLGT